MTTKQRDRTLTGVVRKQPLGRAQASVYVTSQWALCAGAKFLMKRTAALYLKQERDLMEILHRAERKKKCSEHLSYLTRMIYFVILLIMKYKKNVVRIRKSLLKPG